MSELNLRKEKVFHDERFGEASHVRGKAGKYYSINGSVIAKYRNIVLQYCNGRTLLEYGCGTGSGTIEWIKNGAIVTGIDISDTGIDKAKKDLFKRGFSANFYVMNAEKTCFENDCFDVVVGTGILHHLNLRNSYVELSRILKSDGNAIFIEALGHNPLINLYRRLTPSMRTENEHPLKQKDILSAKRYFREIEVSYHCLFTLLAVPFRNTPFFKHLMSFFELIDSCVLRLPIVKKFAWMAILRMSKPIK